MDESISLAEWIAELRAELTEATAWQEERVEGAAKRGKLLRVPPLNLEELKLEIEVRTSRETSGRAGLKFWVVSAEGDRKQSIGATQRVTLLLKPTKEMHLGVEEKPLTE
jgi:Trypsin-co-occurring domain 2